MQASLAGIPLASLAFLQRFSRFAARLPIQTQS